MLRHREPPDARVERRGYDGPILDMQPSYEKMGIAISLSISV